MKKNKILTINCGSATLKYSLYAGEDELLRGNVERIGEKVKDHKEALKIALCVILESGLIKDLNEIKGVGHRVVHGGKSGVSKVINAGVIKELNKYAVLAPLHNPKNIMGIKAAQNFLPKAGHVAVYDTSFHTTIPDIAKTYGLPFELSKKHFIQKYGYHGTSYRYIMRELSVLKKINVVEWIDKVVICHLGNGCSMAAVKNGKSIDTTMAFSTLSGLIMGTRCGDLDPYLPYFIAKNEKKKIEDVYDLMFKKSGLLGLSGISNDMRDLTISKNKLAKFAIDVFCYNVQKTLGGYISLLEGLDAIVFTAGIGQNVWQVREKIMKHFEFSGIKVDAKKNKKNELVISTDDSTVRVLVIPTNEEMMIALDAKRLLKL